MILRKLHLKKPPPKDNKEGFYLSKLKHKNDNKNKDDSKKTDNHCICF